jgi:hypothetical protein
MHVLNTIAPIFLLLLLGVALRRTGFAPQELFRQTNRLVYWIGLPALLFLKTATAQIHGGSAAALSGVLIGGMVACIAIGYAVAYAMRVSRPSVGSFVQAAYRGNLAYIGLPVILFSLGGAEAGEAGRPESVAAVALGPLIPLYNVAAVVVLLAGRQPAGEGRLGQAGRMAATVALNPLLLACAAGLAWAAWGPAIPAAGKRTLEALGQMSLPLALLGAGASLQWPHRAGLAQATAASLIKVGAGPLAGLAIGALAGLPAVEMRIAMIYLACPTAVMSYVMAGQLGGDERLSADAVAVSTVLSLPALAAVLAATS